MSDHLWFPELVGELKKSSHLFINYVAYHRVDEWGECIGQEINEAGFTCESFRLDRTFRFPPDDADVEVALLIGLERLIDRPRALEQLRAQVSNWVSKEVDRKVVVVSRAPRSAYPVGDGSSLVLDSKDLHLRPCAMAEWVIREFEDSGQSLPRGAALSRGLAASVLAIAAEGSLDPRELMSDIACQTLLELGPNYIALLDEWVLEGGSRSVPCVDVPEWMQVELVLAGVARLDLDQQNLILFGETLGEGWMDGLRQASRRCVAAPRDWRDLSACLFEIERILRNALAIALESSLGSKWAKQVIPEAQVRYIRNAAGVVDDFPLHHLANPLDYLTLGQLIDLADARSEASSVGLSSATRLELRRMVPIRNRVGHMRLPRMGDLPAARSALRWLELSLRNSG